jgi:hypothetical protein
MSGEFVAFVIVVLFFMVCWCCLAVTGTALQQKHEEGPVENAAREKTMAPTENNQLIPASIARDAPSGQQQTKRRRGSVFVDINTLFGVWEVKKSSSAAHDAMLQRVAANVYELLVQCRYKVAEVYELTEKVRRCRVLFRT